jgi:hypothetical protein
MGCCLSRNKDDKLKGYNTENSKMIRSQVLSTDKDQMVDMNKIENLLKSKEYNSESSLIITNTIQITDQGASK